jgi:hypothetical protein
MAAALVVYLVIRRLLVRGKPLVESVRQIDRERQRRVRDAIGRGDPVRNADDYEAAVAIAALEQLALETFASPVIFFAELVAATVTLTVFALTGSVFSLLFAALDLLGLVLWVVAFVISRRRRTLIARARAANEQLFGSSR